MAFERETGKSPSAAAPVAATQDAACYISSMAAELAHLAENHRLDTLAYILDMARLEAEQIAKSHGADREPTGAN